MDLWFSLSLRGAELLLAAKRRGSKALEYLKALWAVEIKGRDGEGIALVIAGPDWSDDSIGHTKMRRISKKAIRVLGFSWYRRGSLGMKYRNRFPIGPSSRLPIAGDGLREFASVDWESDDHYNDRPACATARAVLRYNKHDPPPI